MFYLRSFNPSLRRLKRNIKTLKKSNNVILLGVVENIYEYINISTALLFPSTRPHFADPVLEAYKIGTPVIVSDVDGMEEIVSRETGMFFKKNNARDLADKINIFANIDSAKTEEYKLNCLKKYSGIQSKNIKIVDVFEPILLAW